MIKAVGMLIVVAIFVPGLVLSPAVAIELFFGKGKNIFGDKTKAREAYKAFREDQASTERAGKAVLDARLEVDKSEILRDAVAQTNTPTRHTTTPPAGKFWWTNMPRLVPTLDWRCKQAGTEYPFRLNRNDPIAGFTNVDAMITECLAARLIETGIESVEALPDGTCADSRLRCAHAFPSPTGRPACCPLGRPIYNAVDHFCYRNTDYRAAVGPEAQGFMGGEYCPASSPAR